MGPDKPPFQNASTKRSQFIVIKKTPDAVQPEPSLFAAPPSLVEQMGPDKPPFQNASTKRSQFIGIKKAPDAVQPEPSLSATPAYDEDIPFHTYSLQAVTKIQSKIEAKAFFAQLVLLLVSIVFLEALVVLFIALSDPTYRIGVAIVFVITCSYVASGQMKYLDQAHQKKTLTATTLTRVLKKSSSAEREDMMKHMKLLKKETMFYLRSLNKKGLKEGF